MNSTGTRSQVSERFCYAPLCFGDSACRRPLHFDGVNDNTNYDSSARTNAERTGNDAAEHLLYGFLTGRILACFYRVYNALGFGFLESVYCNALAHEFRKAGIPFVREAPVDVWYDGVIVGHFKADFLVTEKSFSKSRRPTLRASLTANNCSTISGAV
jgi:hypothetical protein